MAGISDVAVLFLFYMRQVQGVTDHRDISQL